MVFRTKLTRCNKDVLNIITDENESSDRTKPTIYEDIRLISTRMSVLRSKRQHREE